MLSESEDPKDYLISQAPKFFQTIGKERTQAIFLGANLTNDELILFRGCSPYNGQRTANDHAVYLVSLGLLAMPLPDLLRFLLVVLSCVAGIIDVRVRRIPNWLCAVGLLAGFAGRYYVEGASGLLAAAEGMGLALLIYFPLWLLRGMGAGDVKLMAALGAIAGPAHWFVLFLVASILGAIAAAVVAFRHGRAAKTVSDTLFLAKELLSFRAPWKALPKTDFRHEQALRIPHGGVIAVAALILAALGRI